MDDLSIDVSQNERYIIILIYYAGRHPVPCAWFMSCPGRFSRVGQRCLPPLPPRSRYQPATDIARLRRDLEANLAGIAVILALLDRLTALQREVEPWRGRE